MAQVHGLKSHWKTCALSTANVKISNIFSAVAATSGSSSSDMAITVSALTDCLAHFRATDMRPFSIAEGTGFIAAAQNFFDI